MMSHRELDSRITQAIHLLLDDADRQLYLTNAYFKSSIDFIVRQSLLFMIAGARLRATENQEYLNAMEQRQINPTWMTLG